jgi:hypothetical protein
MHDIERYLLWGAVIVLFVLFLWPKMSGYSGEPNSITKLAEFTSLPVDIQRIYNDDILRAIKAWAPTISKWWSDIPANDKARLKGMFKQAADQQVANAATAKAQNGSDLLKGMMGPPPGQSPQQSPSPSGNAMTNSTTSNYMVQPFMPMMSGFSLQAAIDKANNATKV